MAPKSQSHSAGTESPSLPTAAPSSKEGSEAPTPSKQSRNASPSSSTGAPPKRADSETAPAKAASTSQPMTKTSSSSSGSNPADAKDAATGPSPYGTRSRNRTGRARPNYAEDKDIDSDLFDAAPERKDDGDAKRSTRLANNSSNPTQDAPQLGPSSGSSSSRKPLPTSDDGKHSGTAAAATSTTSTTTNTTSTANKESQQQQQNHTSAASTPAPAVNSATTSQPTKKRKAGNQGNSSGLNQQTGSGNSSTSSNAAHRKSLGGGGGGMSGYAETNMMSFEDCQGRPKNKTLTADDGTILAVNDHVYLICEPPGEPYYIARIMEFLHSKNDASRPVDSIRVNWFYRPKDIGRKAQDTRMLFATMHSDICPLNSLRGKCEVRHKAEIPNAEEYRRNPDCFWWDKMYDRYIQKNYEAIPTSQIINVPERVKKVLDERWKYILVEQGRGKELTSAVKSCKRCSGYCASADSVDCGFCKNTYHMQCVRPPLQKKPARGFGWACGPCNLAQERKLEALNAPHLHDSGSHAEDEELLEEEEEEDPAQANTNRTSPSVEHDHPPPTAEQIYQASLWPFRYLGMHCKIEDALDYDDRIYPRASSRLGPRHQATVGNWPGRAVQFVKPLEIKKTGRKDGRHSKEIQALLEKDKREREQRPKWVQDEPFSGFVPRGLDFPEDDPSCTSTCLWKPAEDADGGPVKDADNDIIISEAGVDDYMNKARSMSKELGLPDRCTNLEDIARDLLYKNNYDAEESLRQLVKTDKSLFKEPDLTASEQKKFEEAVAKFGSELQSVKRYVKTVPHKWIVRHYYKWKKTPQGKKIWGNHPQRKGKKEIKRAQAEASKAADEVADDHDDSAFDTVKAKDKKKNFTCKFCNTKSSRQWRRAPNVSSAVVTENGGKNKEKGTQYVVALCRRCAELWRRYAIQWEDLDEAAKKVAASGGRSWKRKIDEELYKELQAANERMRMTKYSTPEPPPVAPQNAAAATSTQPMGPQEPPRKKLKSERDSEPALSEAGGVGGAVAAKKKEKEKEKEKPAEKPAPPPPPPMPKPKTMPCSICRQLEPLGDQHLQCRECRMTVHRNCYGVIDNRQNGRWICDMCSNDKNPQISLHYKCVLCPVERTEHDFVEPPKISHKKKSEKERERERLEKESATNAADFYRKRQEELGRPVDPREPLKRTADNNWVHVTCAVFHPEIKFGNAKALEPSEGIPSIPRSRYQEICKACKQLGGACVPCHNPTCRTTFHVECAYQQGYAVGFDITPVKGSRRDQHNIVSIGGESGTMAAAIWCKDHVPKTAIHHIEDVVDESGLNALQLYVRNFKQADLTLTGCARKANLIPAAAKPVTASTTTPINRRASTTTLVPVTSPVQVNGAVKEEVPYIMQPVGKVCITCGTDVSPRWHSIDESQGLLLVNGHGGSLGEEAQKFVAQRNYQCHKCKKANRRVEPQPVVKQEASPPPVEVPRSPPPAIQAAASPQNLMSVRNIAPQPWDHPPRQSSLDAPATQPPPMSGSNHGPAFGPPPGPLSVQAPAPIAPPIAPPIVQAPQPQQQPPQLAQPIAAPSMQAGLPPRGPPSHQYPPPQTPPYGEWRRPSSQHGSHPPPPPPPQSHHMNGAHPQIPPSSMPPLAPPNHLRPPPLSSIPPPPPPLQNGHGLGHHYGPPPTANGRPPSPRGIGAPPPLPNGGPYLPQHHQPHSVHHQPPPPPHHLTNGGPPPRAAEHPFSHGLHPQRSPFSTPHGSPPMTRDSVMRCFRKPVFAKPAALGVERVDRITPR
ncbi:hypothetical protein J7T55_008497 [Diaporthe amygdali]|uniref:uncharacterized protein n=1 Tax=Phomopsis amygdali TaxID=1214568 RepID=UPI0022FDF361|nr:uncharacterized protein J7T55_008497 [Diaporthe amygdali]KAJ0121333.1 hypothetical protein J7T55_008497 [Diaporthe amygdali]